MKSIYVFLVAVCLSFPPAAGADYLIMLKNGSQFTTPAYWHTYEELRFYYLGGTVGLKRQAVKKIVSLAPPYREEALPEEMPAPAPGKQETAPAGPVRETSRMKAEEEVYAKKIEAVTARIAAIRTMSREELLALSTEIATLKKEIVSKNLTGLYEGKYQELFTANDAIREELKNRL
ncbi:MAG TPA: hypothetical protein PK175_03310 [Syntrophales bacterium]|nr:hypothetical protein [Syntrophales bacterium]HON23311.1 hypothetical protein [Syntrophales bacterium]HOU77697.1 hypothetical protein [Syntrophales bacterium]HPC32218.1 hypothetical protein [Syntrophales bacterium]HQG33881.1 hypothetical protein [Syntrophales bacterium]